MAGQALPYGVHVMPEFRRRYLPGGIFFFTAVTFGRATILCDDLARSILRACLQEQRRLRPFEIEAMVLLPDHLHMIWRLPSGDTDYSRRWSAIKGNFTRAWLRQGGAQRRVTSAARHQGRQGVWQARFLEHTIRDEDDYIAHVEYIHYNPVKHGLVTCPCDWPYSSLHRFVRQGHYPEQWCCGSAPTRNITHADDLE